MTGCSGARTSEAEAASGGQGRLGDCWGCGGRGGWRFQGAAAIGAEFVAEFYAVLAVGADRLQAVAAAGTEAEGRVDLGVALRAVGGAGFAQDEVEKDAEAVGNENGDEGPENTAHVAASGVLIDVADEDGVAAERGTGDSTEQAAQRQPVSLHVYERRKQDGDGYEDQAEYGVGPRREDADIVLGSRGSRITDCHDESPDAVLLECALAAIICVGRQLIVLGEQ